MIRTPSHLIVVENKVDPGYLDALQITEEIRGGSCLANDEARQFVFVLVAPGPINAVTLAEVQTAGCFISWKGMTELIRSVDTEDLDPFVRAVVEQYAEFMDRRPRRTTSSVDLVVQDCEAGIRDLVSELPAGVDVTAIELWSTFIDRFPDHASALDARYADSSHYSARSWFSAKLQRKAASRDQIEETGEWRKADPQSWGYPKVRVYRRMPD